MFGALLAVAAASVPMSATAQQPPTLASPRTSGIADLAVQAAIDRQNRAYVDALVRADADAFAAIFAEDAVSLPARGAPVRSRPAIRAAIAATLSQVTFQTGRVRTLETHVVGNVAYEIGTYAFDVTTDGVASELHGRYVTVWRRIEQQWSIVLDVSQPGGGDVP